MAYAGPASSSETVFKLEDLLKDEHQHEIASW